MYWKSIDLQTQKAWKESTLIEKESSADLGRRLTNGGRIPGLTSVESWKPVGVPRECLREEFPQNPCPVGDAWVLTKQVDRVALRSTKA